MGSLAGHVAPGIGFLIIGLWHLFNHIKLHSLNPKSYSSQIWFPTSKFRYLEPLFIMIGSTASILTELFIGPHRHQPLDLDGTIPSNHLHTFEHASISLSLLVYGAFVVFLDKITLKNPRYNNRSLNSMRYLVASIAFFQELLLFILHSADHKGPEGQYHLFLQLIISLSLFTTLMGIGLPNSFMVSFVRSLSIFFQGVWFVVTGIMLWTPQLLPKGCFINDEDGRKVARCSGEESLHRAKSLINLEFSWYLTLTTVFGVSFYLVLFDVFTRRKIEYCSLPRREEEEELDVIESQKKIILIMDQSS